MGKYYFLFNEGSTVNQIICAFLINLPVFGYGIAIGWMSPMTLLLQSANSPTGRPLTDSEISWMGSAAYLTCVPANLLMAFVGDRIGRKFTLLFVTSALVGCWIIKLSSLEISAFIAARILIGINMAGCYVICPSYTKEISQDSIRGFLGATIVLFQTTGNLFAYVIGDVLSYNTILWVGLSVPTLHLVLFMMMPESPFFLLKQGNVDEAGRVLAWLRCRDEDDLILKKELEDMKRQQEKDDSEQKKFLIKNILSDTILRRAFIIALAVTLAREVCGSIPVLSFAGDIFTIASKGSSLVLTPNQQAMMLGAVQVAGSAVASSLVEKTGRKILLFVTALISGLSMCALASWFLVQRYDVYAPAWIPIVTLCLCIFCDSSGLQPVSMVVTGEIFSFKYRGTVMAATMAGAAFSAFLQMLFFKPLTSAIGAYVAFFFFGFICLAAATYVLIVIPETRNKTLEEIYDSLKTKKEKERDVQLKQSEGLSDTILRRAFIIALAVTLAREVCGSIPVLSFAGDIFTIASKGSSLVLTPNQQAMMLGAVQVAGSAVASSLVEKTGRKILLFVTALISGLSMCALASWFLVQRYDVYAPAWIPIVTLCLCIFCDSSGLQPVSMVVTGEIFSFKYRGTVMAATMAGAAFSAFLQMLFFKPLTSAIGAYVAFFFFGFICLAAATYVLIVIPETRNKTLEEIYDSLKTKKEKERDVQLKQSEGC